MLVVGFDPGVATGWCVYDHELGEVVGSGVVHLELGKAEDIEGVAEQWMEAEMLAANELYTAVTDVAPSATWRSVGCEDFILRKQNAGREALSPVRMAARLHERFFGRWMMVSPSSAKSVVTDERLKEWGLWLGNAHERDSLRVAIVAARSYRS